MDSYIFENARILDGSSDEGEHDRFVRVAGNHIEEISDRPIKSTGAKYINLRGKTLMPGLIDCHVHINSAGSHDLAECVRMPNELVAYHSVKLLRAMLHRGFTTIRDPGGATFAQVQAVEQGLVEGPRLVICGKAFVQTGGHVDVRSRYDLDNGDYLNRLGACARVTNGVDQCRQAARDEIRKGARFLKIMAGGGAASLHFPREYLAYSMDELRAFKEEADNAKMYVCVHTHTDEAVRRALDCGIQSIEHATLITPETAAIASRQNVTVCPTIVAYEAQIREAKTLGLDPDALERLKWVRARGPESLEIMHRAGVKLAYGSDALGFMGDYQSEEFLIRAEVLPPIEVIRSATVNAARLARMEGLVGTISVGAFADLLILDADPLKDLSVLCGQGQHMLAIMKNGAFVKNQLDA